MKLKDMLLEADALFIKSGIGVYIVNADDEEDIWLDYVDTIEVD